MSLVAAIIDKRGGVRVQVGTVLEIIAATGRNESYHIVPGLTVCEPVAHEQIPGMINTAHAFVCRVAWHRLSSRTRRLLRSHSPAPISRAVTLLS
jgi:hypothetical protein